MKIIGRGAQCEVFLCDGRALKVYRQGVSREEAENEARKHKLALRSGLPAPAIYEVTEYEGRPALIMEYIKGPLLGKLYLTGVEYHESCMSSAALLQTRMHQLCADDFPYMNEMLERKIKCASGIGEPIKDFLIRTLREMDCDNKVCHGDFHLFNLIQTDDGIKIIDWVDASSGSPEADACRSYLLCLQHSEPIAQLYLDAYCSASGRNREKILRWLPLLAAARLSENPPDRDRLVNLAVVAATKSDI